MTQRTSHYLGNSRALTVLQSGIKIIVDTDDLSITPHILADGCWATQVDAVLARHVNRGDKTLDIGCHYGYTALMLGALSAEQVVCIDMNAKMTELCAQNLELNGFKHEVTTAGLVALDRLDAEMPRRISYIDKGAISGGNHLTPHGFLHRDDIVHMTALTVAEFQADRAFDFIKIDAEGMDWYIFSQLKGVKKCVLEHRPVDAESHRGAWYTGDLDWRDLVCIAFMKFDVFVIDAKGETHLISSAEMLLEEEGLTHADLLLIAKP